MEGYHWRDGVYFNRLPDGSVTIRLETSADKYFDVGTIPAMEWASIVHAMGAQPESTGVRELLHLTSSDFRRDAYARIGAWVRTQREAQGMGVREFARACAVNPGHLSAIEGGDLVSRAAVDAVLRYVGTPVGDWLAAPAPAEATEARDAMDFCPTCKHPRWTTACQCAPASGEPSGADAAVREALDALKIGGALTKVERVIRSLAGPTAAGAPEEGAGE